MPKTRRDFELESPAWLIEDWLPIGHRGMDTAPEGSFKTIMGCWFAVCIASGSPIFGSPVTQGNVLLIDEETPESSLVYHLQRFSAGLGLNYRDLPIYQFSMSGFRFGRKTELDKLLKLVRAIEPVFIRMDSLLAMLPGGRQATSENDCHLGEMVRDDLTEIMSNVKNCSILLSAHSKKYIAEVAADNLSELAMQTIVRGHGSIVGEGCDTGYILKKISEYPKPSRFSIITKARRQAIPFSQIRYIEMKEQQYGLGWARLEEISKEKLPPTDFAREIYPIFLELNKRGSFSNHSTEKIVRTCAFLSKRECKEGVRELSERRIITKGKKAQSYILNPNRFHECNADYLSELKT